MSGYTVVRKTFLIISDIEKERRALVTVAGIVNHRVILQSGNTVSIFEVFILLTIFSTEKPSKCT